MDVQVTSGECRTVRVSGELDLSNVGDLRSAIDKTIERSPQGFVIDLTDVSYMDSAGVAVVISAYRRIGKLGGSLAVVLPKAANVRRIFELIGLDMLPGIIVRKDSTAAKEALTAAHSAKHS